MEDFSLGMAKETHSLFENSSAELISRIFAGSDAELVINQAAGNCWPD